jgi:hypothetical protein
MKLRQIDRMNLFELRATSKRIKSCENIIKLREEQSLIERETIVRLTELQWELAAELARNGIDETQYDKHGEFIAPPSDDKDTP